MTKRLAVLGVLAAAALALALALFFSGALDSVRPSGVRTTLLDLGVWGPVLFIACFALAHLLQVPSLPFLVTAPLTWPAPVAFLTLWLGSVIAGLPGFVVARYVAHDWVQAHLPARLHRYDRQIAERGLRAIIGLRLFFFTAPYLPPVIALTRTRLRDFLLGSAIGLLPGALLWGFGGQAMFAWTRRQPPTTWALLAVAAGAVALAVWTYRRRAVPQPGEA